MHRSEPGRGTGTGGSPWGQPCPRPSLATQVARRPLTPRESFPPAWSGPSPPLFVESVAHWPGLSDGEIGVMLATEVAKERVG